MHLLFASSEQKGSSYQTCIKAVCVGLLLHTTDLVPFY